MKAEVAKREIESLDYYLQNHTDDYSEESHTAMMMAISALSENKSGKWKRKYLDHVAMGERPSILYCSICCQCIAYPTNFCPNCGADMRGET